jgi:hypothetical protein
MQKKLTEISINQVYINFPQKKVLVFKNNKKTIYYKTMTLEEFEKEYTLKES